MRLWHRAVVIILISLLLLISALAWVQRFVVTHSFAQLEQEDTLRNVERARNAVDNELAHIDSLVHDWAVWDDTYQFVADGNQAFIDANMTDETFIFNHLNVIAVVNTQGRVVYAKSFDPIARQTVALPGFLATQMDPSGPLVRPALSESGVTTGTLRVDQQTLLVASRPILTSLGDGPSRGALIMGRFANEAFFEELSATVQMPVRLQRLDVPSLPADMERARAQLGTVGQLWVQALDAQSVAGYTLLSDVNNQPTLLLRVVLPRVIYQYGQTSFRTLAVAVVPITLAIGVLILALLESTLLTRINSLGRQASSLGEATDLSGRILLRGRDELNALAERINQMLAHLQRAEDAGRRRERYVEGLAKAAQALLASAPEIPYQTFLEALAEASQASRAYIYIAEQDATGQSFIRLKAGWYAPAACDPQGANELTDLPMMPSGFERWAQVFERGEVISGRVDELPAAERALLQSMGAQSIVALPLVVDDRVEGFIGFDQRDTPREWEASEMDLLRAAAADLTQALKRQQNERVRDVIYRISEAVHTVDNLAQLYPVIRQLVSELLPAHDLYIALRNTAQPEFNLVYAVSERGRPFLPRREGGLTAYVLKTGQALLVTREQIRAMVARGELQPSEHYPEAWLGVPLRVQDEILGVLAVLSMDNGERFGEREKQILTFVSTQVALAIQRKRAEEELRRERDLSNELIQASPAYVLAVDAAGRVLMMNQPLLTALGYTLQEVQGQDHVTLLIPEEDRATLEITMRRALVASRSYVGQHRVRCKDGRLLLGEWYMRSLFRPDGSRDYGLALGIDVAARQRAEDALWQIKVLLENSSVVLFRRSADGKIDFVSDNIAQFGYSAEELLRDKVPYESLVYPEDLPRLTQEGGVPARPADSSGRCEYRLVCKDGQVRWVEERSTPVRAPDGHISHNQGVLLDITERRQAEAERDKLQAELHEAQKMQAVGLLAGGVAHDFNNLLTVMLGNAELGLQITTPDNPLYKELEAIQRTAQRAAALTQQLLAFGRRQILRPRALGLNPLVSDLALMLHRVIGEPVQLETHLAATLPDVLADPSSVEQVLMNLVLNARDAMPQGGLLTLSTQDAYLDENYAEQHPGVKAGHYVQVSVVDTGIGMDAATLGHIFEPFFTTKDQGKGTGLGLAAVYGIVRQHDGWIDVASKPGEGTRFDVYWPVCTTPSAQPETSIVQSTTPAPGHETLLLAEDEVLVRELAQSLLQRLGYEVVVAQDGQEALDLFTQQPDRFDLVILDAVMPHLGGPKAYEAMNALRPGLPVLFITGYNPEMIGPSPANGMRLHVLQKPFALSDLAQRVREAFGR